LIETTEQIKPNYPCFPKEFSILFLVMKRSYYSEINVVLLLAESILEIIFFIWEKIKTMEKLISYSSLCYDLWSGN